jgi:hypothetical protein
MANKNIEFIINQNFFYKIQVKWRVKYKLTQEKLGLICEAIGESNCKSIYTEDSDDPPLPCSKDLINLYFET